jgi:hydrogenase nickel incorporation protein HypA/HybF
MHEASIACSIIEIAEDHCRKAGYKRIDSIEVTIGSASGVLPDALLMAFEIARADTLAGGASLIINHVSLGGACRECGEDFETDEAFILHCPRCGGKDFSLTRGRELDITEIEVN